MTSARKTRSHETESNGGWPKFTSVVAEVNREGEEGRGVKNARTVKKSRSISTCWAGPAEIVTVMLPESLKCSNHITTGRTAPIETSTDQ